MLVALVMAWALFIAMDFPFLARIYPLMAGSFALVMAILLVIAELRVRARDKRPLASTSSGTLDIGASSSMPVSERARKTLRAFVWFSASYLAIWLLGFKIGIAVFLIAYVGFKGRARWFMVLGLLVLLAALLSFFDIGLKVYWPSGLLQLWLGERWPWLF